MDSYNVEILMEMSFLGILLSYSGGWGVRQVSVGLPDNTEYGLTHHSIPLVSLLVECVYLCFGGCLCLLALD